jgi:predicted phage terminase large subunit-like protein
MTAEFASIPRCPKLEYYLPPVATSVDMAIPEDIGYIRMRSEFDLEFFVRHFLGHHFYGDLSALHDYICELDPEEEGMKRAIAAPRGNCKTTFAVLARPLHDICYSRGRFTLIIGHSAQESIDKTSDILNELVHNEELIRIYGKLITERKPAKSDFKTKNGIRVLAKSKGAQVRGLKNGPFRPDRIICDDIETLEGVNTPEQRQKTMDWFMKDVMMCGRPDGTTNITLVGTVLHEEGLLATLLKSKGWICAKFKSIISDAVRQDLWDQWRLIFGNLEDPDAADHAKAFFTEHQAAMMEGVEVLWPSGEPYYNLQVYIQTFGLAAFFSEKQNDPFDPERQILHPDKSPRFEVIWPDDERWPKEWDGHPWKDGTGWCLRLLAWEPGRWLHQSDMESIIAFHDPALAEEKKSDYAAIVVVAQDFNERLYCLEAVVKKIPTTPQIEAAFNLYRKWGLQKIYLETNNFQKLLKQPYVQMGELHPDVDLQLIGVKQHANKKARIGTLEPYFTNGWLCLHQNMDGELINQLKLFPTGHDDGPDALEGACRKLKRPRAQVVQMKGPQVL